MNLTAWNAMSNNTRTAVSLAFGLGVSFVFMILFNMGPALWDAITKGFKTAYSYSARHPGTIAQAESLMLFAVLTLLAMLREKKSVLSERVQMVMYFGALSAVVLGLAVTLASVVPRDVLESKFLILAITITYLVLAVALKFGHAMMHTDGTKDEPWTAYGMTKQLAFFVPPLFLLFDASSTNIALMLGLWFMLFLLPPVFSENKNMVEGLRKGLE